ncbi:MAG: putative Ser/Thr protein kinase [Pseudohongiellaceae bacterium]|jgi:predicted Ser/Thr protein kinase
MTLLEAPAPWCALSWRVLSEPRTPRKARVLLADGPNGPVVCKDFSDVAERRRFDLTWRWRKSNECAALVALDGLPGVPNLLANWPTGMIMEFVPGRPLGRLGKQLPAGVFDRLDALLDAIHNRGVAITDLHRLNILVADDGAVHIVDFELALLADRGPGRLFKGWAASMDEHAAGRQRRRHGLPLSAKQQQLLADPPAGRRALKALKRGIRNVKVIVLGRRH